MKSFLQDLRYGLRQLRNNRGFAVTAIITLSLGIGASAAIFAFVDAALIKPLILGEAGTLALIGIAAGLVCSFVAAILMRSLLFGVRPWDAQHLWRLRSCWVFALSWPATFPPAAPPGSTPW
jgi:hypothetical protein